MHVLFQSFIGYAFQHFSDISSLLVKFVIKYTAQLCTFY